MYNSVHIWIAVQSKKTVRHILIVLFNKLDDDKVLMTTELLLLVKYAFSKI
jgi:hypothetical protein